MVKWLLRRCKKCKRYTLHDMCPYCGEEVRLPHPAKFSLDDRYVEYRVSRKTRPKSSLRKENL